MATTYMQLAQQIKALQAQAEQVKKKETAGVIASIKEAIAVYSLTAEELGLSGKSGAKSVASGKKPAARTGRGKKMSAKRVSIAYQDGSGNTWGGRGPRPAWLRSALEGGATLESFAAGVAAPSESSRSAENEGEPMAAAPVKKGRAAKAVKAPKAAAAVKYKDDAGHTWSGFGPKPGWFKEALAAGKSLEALAAQQAG